MSKEEIEECIGLQIKVSQGHQRNIDKHTDLIDRQTTILESLYHRIKLLTAVILLTWMLIFGIALCILING